MPSFSTGTKYFPPAELANEDGLIAIGGSLSKESLLAAYRNGIYPWFNEGDPIMWWSPDPRFVLYPNDFRYPRSMRPIINKGVFEITFNKNFEEIIRGCQQTGNRTNETWITEEMVVAYSELHAAGYAHSIEAWRNNKLAGGLYGVKIGAMFCGESMFARESNASKAAFIALMKHASDFGIKMIDCQLHTVHLERFGAKHIPREQFLKELKNLRDQ